MFSRTAKPGIRSAAWRISLWATLAFACGTMLVFMFLHGFVADDIQRRVDAWLSGEAEFLHDVTEQTPRNALYDRMVSEVTELFDRELASRLLPEAASQVAVFVLETNPKGEPTLWVGMGSVNPFLDAIQKTGATFDRPRDLRVQGFDVPFRVVSTHLSNGNIEYLGLSEREELRVLRQLRIRFIVLWPLLVFLGFAIVFFTTRNMLRRVQRITQAASHIGHSDLTARVPQSERNDEIGHLGRTLNGMLDRIEKAMDQLHTITGSLAHDLRSPLTAIRGKLEMSLSAPSRGEQDEAVVACIEELDRLTEFLNTSLDVAEAKADALRLSRSPIQLDELLRSMIDLYEPSMSERGLQIHLQCDEPIIIQADAALIHRMMANLFENELKHLPPHCTINLHLSTQGGNARLTLEDNGPGFAPEVRPHIFERRIKGRDSSGHGLGLAFVDAVIRAHGGTVSASNREQGGACITLSLPLLSPHGNGSAVEAVHGIRLRTHR